MGNKHMSDKTSTAQYSQAETSMSKVADDQQGTGWIAGDAHNELTGHEYDGIQEYDNPLPGWWKWLFIVSIIFFFPYFAYYHFGGSGRSVSDGYQVAEAVNARKQLAGLGEIKPDRQTLVRFASTGGGGLAVGRGVYLANCVACHGTSGGGLIGPNLTDNHYKNVREIEDILNIVNRGAAAGAMPAWINRLDEAECVLVSAYVASMRGTDPGPGAKAAEGSEIAPWPTPDELAAQEAAKAAEEEAQGEGEAEGEGPEAAAAEPVTAESPVMEGD